MCIRDRCSLKHKIGPQEKFCNHYPPCRKVWAAGKRVVKFIGYDAGEGSVSYTHLLKTIYKDAADTIVGNCDSTMFLGGKEKSTLKPTAFRGKSPSSNLSAQVIHQEQPLSEKAALNPDWVEWLMGFPQGLSLIHI